MTLATHPYDSSEYLDSEEAIAAYLDEALASGDAALIAHALSVVARARGIAQLAGDLGLSGAPSAAENPELGTVLRVMKALGLRLTVRSEPAAAP